MIHHVSRRLFLFCGLSVFGAFLGRADDATKSTKEAPVTLPTYTVTDSRELPPPESWRYGEIPGFEVLSNASESASTRLLKDFGLFKQALNLVWPMPDRRGFATSIILCGKGGKFSTFLPPTNTPGEMTRASLFFQNQQHSSIIINLEVSIIDISGSDSAAAGTETDTSQVTVDHNKQLYREYLHYLLGRGDVRFPAWFEEGMVQIIARMEFDRTHFAIGRLENSNTISAQAANNQRINEAGASDDADPVAGAPVEDNDFNVALRRQAILAMDKLFAVDHDAPEALNPLGNNRWAKQCYAFVHMCLFGEGKKYQKPMITFLTRLQREPLSEALFKECFKMSYKDMATTIRIYCDSPAYQAQESTAKKGVTLPMPPELVLREATPAEVGRIKGEAYSLAGLKDKARTELIAPYIRNDRDPRLLVALGLFDQANGEEARGRKLLEAATAAKVVQPEAYLKLAQLRFADAAKAAGPEGVFTDAQVASITDPLNAARPQPPPLHEIYELLAETWTRSATTIKREDALVLIRASMFFPTRLKLIYQTALLSADAGVLDAAHTLADHGIKYAPDAATRAKFEQLKASLPPAPPAAEKPAAAGAPAPK